LWDSFYVSAKAEYRGMVLSVSSRQVLERLPKVIVAARRRLAHANVCPRIAVNDGMVFFSLNVHAAEARAWKASGRSRSSRARHSRRHGRDDRVTGRHARRAQHLPRRRIGMRKACRHLDASSAAATASASPMSKQSEIPGRCRRSSRCLRQGRRRKSTTRSTGIGLRDLGLRVGCSMPTSMDRRCRADRDSRQPQLTDDKKMIPMQRFGLAIMSIVFWSERTAMIGAGHGDVRDHPDAPE